MELFLRTGRPASEIFREQREGDEFRGTRWDTLVFWVWAGKEGLFERLDRRVDKMVEAGVERECRELYEVSKQTDIPIDSGIFAAIGYPPPAFMLMEGYKEFLPVIQAEEATDVEASRQEAIAAMKRNTRKYVTSQIKWLKHQLLPQCHHCQVQIYIFDASDPAQWSTKVLSPALAIARAFHARQPLPPPASVFERADELLNPVRSKAMPEEWKHWECGLCVEDGEPFVVVGGEEDWNLHLQSRKHKQRRRALQKRIAFEEWKAKQVDGKLDTLGS